MWPYIIAVFIFLIGFNFLRRYALIMFAEKLSIKGSEKFNANLNTILTRGKRIREWEFSGNKRNVRHDEVLNESNTQTDNEVTEYDKNFDELFNGLNDDEIEKILDEVLE